MRIPHFGVVYDGIGGENTWRSREALRPGGRVVAFGLTASLSAGRVLPGRPSARDRLRVVRTYAGPIVASWLLPGNKKVVPYSIQWLKRLRPAVFKQDLTALLELLRAGQVKPIIAGRFPLAQARRAHELLGKGGVTGKIVLVNPSNV